MNWVHVIFTHSQTREILSLGVLIHGSEYKTICKKKKRISFWNQYLWAITSALLKLNFFFESRVNTHVESRAYSRFVLYKKLLYFIYNNNRESEIALIFVMVKINDFLLESLSTSDFQRPIEIAPLLWKNRFCVENCKGLD